MYGHFKKFKFRVKVFSVTMDSLSDMMARLVIKSRGHLTKFISFGRFSYSLTSGHERGYLETILTRHIIDQRFIPGKKSSDKIMRRPTKVSDTKQRPELVFGNSNIFSANSWLSSVV